MRPILSFLVCIMALTLNADELSVEKAFEDTRKNNGDFKVLEVELCSALGERLCHIMTELCIESEFKHTCFVLVGFRSLMEFEYCGEERMVECEDVRKIYSVKVADFMGNYVKESGIGWQAFNSCEPFYRIYPKSELLKELSQKIELIRPDHNRYYDYKGLYECIKEQYLKISRG